MTGDLLRCGLAAAPARRAPEIVYDTVWNGRRDKPGRGYLTVEADEPRQPPPEMVEPLEPGQRRTGSRLPSLRT